MLRKTGIDAPGAFHHVIIHGIEHKAIFRDVRIVIGTGSHKKANQERLYFSEMNQAYLELMGGDPPARITVGGAE